MKKNKISLKQNDGNESKRWLKMFDEMVLTDFSASMEYLIFSEKDNLYDGYVQALSRYLVEDINAWKKYQVRVESGL